MRCNVCNREWNIMEGTSQSVKCPYCGAIPQKGNISSISLNEAVKRIIDSYGVDILLSKSKFLSIFSDIAPKLVDERNIFTIALSENVASIILDNSISESERITIIQSQLSNILAKPAIDSFVESIVFALNWSHNVELRFDNDSIGAATIQVGSINGNNSNVSLNSYNSISNNVLTNTVSNSIGGGKGSVRFKTFLRLLPALIIGIIIMVCVINFVDVNTVNNEFTTKTSDGFSDISITSNTNSIASSHLIDSNNDENKYEETISDEKHTDNNEDKDSLDEHYEDNLVNHISDFKSCINSISSSSQRLSETYGDKTYSYPPQKAFDNDMSTCWCEGADGYGIGESITVNLDDPYEIREICLWNGLCTSKELFYKNSRIRDFRIILSNGESYSFVCDDGWDNRKNTFLFKNGIVTSSLKIIIDSVYEGEKYSDTCISEISVL